MRSIVFLTLVSASLFFASPGFANFPEQTARDDTKAQASFLFQARKFGELNALAEQSRRKTTPSGDFLLPFFYQGLDDYARMEAPALAIQPNDARWQAMVAMAQDWIKQAPSPSARIFLGKVYFDWAIAYRGDGFANDVPKQNWAPFFAKLKQARRVFEAEKADADVDPEWYRTMILIAREEQWPDRVASPLYEQALGKYPDYNYIYFELGASLQPQWGGNWKAFDQLARYAIEKTKNTEGASLYARMYWSIQGSCGCIALKDTAVDWHILKKGFRDLVQRHPSQWNTSAAAYFACMANDKEETKFWLQKITEFSIDTWQNRMDYYTQCQLWALKS